MISYLDSSALLKICRAEDESASLAAHLQTRDQAYISTLTETECRRAAAQLGIDQAVVTATVATTARLSLTDEAFATAGALPGQHLRTLDAMHIAAALLSGADEFVTYDHRQAAAAREAGLTVVAPASHPNEG